MTDQSINNSSNYSFNNNFNGFISASSAANTDHKILAISVLTEAQYDNWLVEQSSFRQNYLAQIPVNIATCVLLPEQASGELAEVVFIVKELDVFWCYASLVQQLPPGYYQFQQLSPKQYTNAAIAWGLASYQFSYFKSADMASCYLVLPDAATWASYYVTAHHFVRDLVNRPANDLTPEVLGHEVQMLAETYQADYRAIVGEDLLTENYPLIYAVGKASSSAPRLLDLTWGDPNAPKLTLVGKGVCFDSGGLNIKPDSGMSLMRKDMGGAAHVLGLARLIMAYQLPVRLRVLIPAVENAIAGNAMRVGDIYRSRQGLSVEITNTDAEGRLILADALSEACNDKPDLLIDLATLTGAAKVALGPDVPAIMGSDQQLLATLVEVAKQQHELLWPLPLYAEYNTMLNTFAADIKNCTDSGFAGAITAGLFLQRFVTAETPWIHVDLMAWNKSSRPGRPEGGEAMGLRTLFYFIQEYFSIKINLA